MTSSMKDYRLKEGLNACINCGTCTAICPAAEFYRYDPRRIVDIVQSKDEEEIEKLLKSDTIWYCGECMSCVTRCPRKNAPGLIIMALRSLSIDLGYFIESEKGRQQYLDKRLVRQHPGLWLLRLSAPFRLRRTSRGRKGLGMGGEALGRCVREARRQS